MQDLWGCKLGTSASTQDYKEDIVGRGRVSVRICAGGNQDIVTIDECDIKAPQNMNNRV